MWLYEATLSQKITNSFINAWCSLGISSNNPWNILDISSPFFTLSFSNSLSLGTLSIHSLKFAKGTIGEGISLNHNLNKPVTIWIYFESKINMIYNKKKNNKTLKNKIIFTGWFFKSTEPPLSRTSLSSLILSMTPEILKRPSTSKPITERKIGINFEFRK